MRCTFALVVFAFLNWLPLVFAYTDVEYWVDCAATSSGDGSELSPFATLDEALDATSAFVGTTHGLVQINLMSPGEYPLQKGEYIFGGGEYVNALTITGVPTSWVGDQGPTIVRGGPDPKVQFTMAGLPVTMTSLKFGLPAQSLEHSSDSGTLFYWFFEFSHSFVPIDFESVTFEGRSDANFVTKENLLTIQFYTEGDDFEMSGAIGVFFGFHHCTVLPGVVVFPSLHNAYIAISNLKLQEPASLIYPSRIVNLKIRNVCVEHASIVLQREGFAEVIIRDVLFERNDIANPLLWCNSIVTTKARQAVKLTNVIIRDWSGSILDAVQGSVTLKDVTVSNSRSQYPNEAYVEYGDAAARQTNFINVDINAQVTLNGGRFEGNVGRTQVTGTLTIIGTEFVDQRTEPSSALQHETHVFNVLGAGELNFMATEMKATVKSFSTGLLLAEGTSKASLDGVTISGYHCKNDCIHVREMAELHIGKSSFDDLSTEGSVLFYERSDINDNWPTTLIFECAFTGIRNAVLRGSLGSVEVSQSTFSNFQGSSLLQPQDESHFAFIDSSFSNGYTPGDGPVLSDCQGAVEFTNVQFIGNHADGRGGALAVNVAPGACDIKLTNRENTARVGGGMFIDWFTESPAVLMKDVTFERNVAELYGGGLYTLAMKKVPVDASVTFNGNQAHDMPQGGTSASEFEAVNAWSELDVLSGEQLPTFSVKTRDAFGQDVSFDQENLVIVSLSVWDEAGTALTTNATLSGQILEVLQAGTRTFEGVRIYGKSGSYLIKLADDTASGKPDFEPVMLPVRIVDCASPKQMLPSFATGELECRLPVCLRGCSSPAGVCAADGNCTCVDRSYEGYACQLKKGANDSLTMSFDAGNPVFKNGLDTFDFSVSGRDAMIQHLEGLYDGQYGVIFRDFWTGSQRKLARRSGGENTVYLKFSLVDKVGSYLDYRQLQSAVGVLKASLISPDTSGLEVTTGALANTDITAVGSIIAIICCALGVVTVTALAVLRFRKGDGPTVRGTSRHLDLLLAFGLANLFALPITDTVTPTAASCRAQIWMIPLSFGLIVPTLVVKSFGHFTRRKNKIALRSDIPLGSQKLGTAFIGATQVMYWVLVIVWQVVEAPTPQLTFSNNELAACRLAYDTITVGWPVPAMEDRLLFANAANMIVLGAVAAGLLLSGVMNGSTQFAIRVTVALVVASILTLSMLGYKVWLLRLPDKTEDHIEQKVRSMASKGQASNLYQKVKYLPCKPESGIIWRASQISLLRQYLEITDIDTMKGRFFRVTDLTATADIASNCVIVQLPGEDPLRIQLEDNREVENWVKRLNESQATLARKGNRISVGITEEVDGEKKENMHTSVAKSNRIPAVIAEEGGRTAGENHIVAEESPATGENDIVAEESPATGEL
ncbi:hypothetical protein HDU85_004260 [Gaertneriomyces sp. JEL0708]|nr:hypothetical protein HDU85_004260 [Gaertneriomyces sp. JEL0708]